MPVGRLLLEPKLTPCTHAARLCCSSKVTFIGWRRWRPASDRAPRAGLADGRARGLREGLRDGRGLREFSRVRERRAPREPHTELPWSSIDYHKWKRERCRAREIASLERRIEHRVRGGSWAEGVVPNPVR